MKKLRKKPPFPAPEKAAQRRHSNRGPDGRFLRGKSGLPESCQHNSHGLSAMKRAMGQLCDSGNWPDTLGPLGAAVRDWQQALISDLGGPEAISTQQKVLVDLSSKTMLLLASVDDWLLRQSPINKRKRSLLLGRDWV